MSPAPKLEIPLWSAQPGRTCDSRKEEKHLIIPLSIKASVPRDIDSYASALPRHQAGRAADVAARRIEAAFWSDGACEQWGLETGAPVRTAPDGAASEVSDGGGVADESAQCSDEERPPDGEESPVSALRRARLRAECARRRAALAAAEAAAPGAGRRLPAGKVPTFFSAAVVGLDGRGVEVGGLWDQMQVPDFCERVADAFQIPTFAVRLMVNGNILHMSQPGVSLSEAGVAEGAQLTLVKQWGWSKPDVRMLADLLRK